MPPGPPRPLTRATLLQGVGELGARDPQLAIVVQRCGPPPLWGRPPGFATLVRIILEQQVSLASGRAAYARLQAVAVRVTPHRVAALSESRLRRHGLTRQKAAYCRNLACFIVDRRLVLGDLDRLDDRDAHQHLLQIPGIGPWTADVFLLMALRRPDVWPVGDLALAKSAQQVKRLRVRPSQEKLRHMARRWAPWRAVAARILWHAYLEEKGRRGAGRTTGQGRRRPINRAAAKPPIHPCVPLPLRPFRETACHPAAIPGQ